MAENPEVLLGDCREVLPTLEGGSVQCCVTSPPYWGLRDYGTAQWEGGEVGCDHVEFVDLRLDSNDGKLTGTRGTQSATRIVHTYRDNCGKCGARRIDSQLGLETTPEEYIANMVAVFREVWRVLRDDGTLWLNMGDSYATNGERINNNGSGTSTIGWPWQDKYPPNKVLGMKTPKVNHGLKPKDLCLMPSRLAQALQQPFYIGNIKSEKDRVWLAAIIDGEGSIFIHRKPEGTPTGRNGTSKYTRASFCAGIAISNTNKTLVDHAASILGKDNVQFCESKTENSRDSWQWRITGNQAKKVLLEVYPYLVAKQREARLAIDCPPSGDRASVIWQALKDVHKGIESSIDANESDTSSLWEPGWYLRSDIIWHKPNPMPESVTDRPTKSHEYIFLLTKAERYFYDAEAIRELAIESGNGTLRFQPLRAVAMSREPSGNEAKPSFAQPIRAEYRNKRSVWTIATQPFSGAHFATFPEEIPKLCILAGSKPGDTVLDPFAGSGTVGQVALELGRRAILIELNPAYIELARDRTLVTPGFF